MSEYVAASALERCGYAAFFPRVKTPAPRAGHDDTPLFPGYLFIKYDDTAASLPHIGRIAGLIGWVQFDGVVPSVPDEVVAELELRIMEMNEQGGYWNRFRPGETVRVVTGQVDSLAQVLEEARSPQSRVKVLMGFMGGLVYARVPWQDLQAVAAPDGNGPDGPSRPSRRTRGKGRWINGFGPRAGTGVYQSGN